MKKITLFIAFLAISIGAVWGQESGESQEPSDPQPSVVTVDNSQYKIYPAEGSSSPYAVLISFSASSSSKKGISLIAQILEVKT